MHHSNINPSCHICVKISQTLLVTDSGKFKYLSLDVPSSTNDSQLSMELHSVSQVNMLTAFNKEAYSFIANSLYLERKGKNQPSLSGIFKRYCQNEHPIPGTYHSKETIRDNYCLGKMHPLIVRSLTSVAHDAVM